MHSVNTLNASINGTVKKGKMVTFMLKTQEGRELRGMLKSAISTGIKKNTQEGNDFFSFIPFCSI